MASVFRSIPPAPPSVRAFVKMFVADYTLTRFATVVTSLPEVIECHRVTGAESRNAVRSRPMSSTACP